jgi:hypothetical protein
MSLNLQRSYYLTEKMILRLSEHILLEFLRSSLRQIAIPKKIGNAMKLKKGESLRVYTDGERIYLDSFEEPVI